MFQLASRDSEHKLLDNFGPKVPVISRAREAIAQQLQVHERLASYKEKASLLLRILHKIQQCKDGEYERLLGVLHLIASSKSNATLERNLERLERMPGANLLSKEIAALVSALHHMLRNTEQRNRSPLSQEIAEEVLLLIRATYPLGINICNPTWSDEKLPLGLPSDTSIMLSVSQPAKPIEWMVIKPEGGRSVVKIIPRGKKWEDIKTSVQLQEGSTILAGRIREFHHFFGMPFTEEIRIIPQLLIQDTAWSRLGVMIARQGDSIFVFDRGSRYPLHCALGNGTQLMYVPRPIVNENENVSFGDSSIVG